MKYLCYVLHRYAFVALTETSRIKPVYEVVGYLVYRHKTNALPFLMNALPSSFPQSMIARPVLNLLKSRDTIAVL